MGPPGSATGPPPLPTTIRIGKNPCGGILSQDDYDDGSTVDYSTSRQGNNGNGNGNRAMAIAMALDIVL